METPPQTNEQLENNLEIISPIEVKEGEKDVLVISPRIHHIFLIVCVVIAISIVLFLIYQNGKSIYDRGI